MKFDRKLKEHYKEDIWKEYCGFLDLSIEEYMHIQYRLMNEQIQLWSECALGQCLLKGRQIGSIAEFRQDFPLTTYETYADVLLMKKGNMLPEDPIVWIQTTWEGGKHPVKLAPYSKSMLNTYRTNVIACLILATSTQRKKFDVTTGDTMLYGLAPLPYATGLLPLLLGDEIQIEFLPSVKTAEKLSFSERNKLGFKLGLSKGIDLFFGVGSVAYFVSKSFSSLSQGSSNSHKLSFLSYSPKMLLRYLKAKQTCKKEERELKPKDIFRLKGFMCAGTDNSSYKDELEDFWGIRPVEVFAGTEPGCMGCETWAKNGLYFFPDSCFYEFIPEAEMNRSLEDLDYQPKTYLMDQVIPGELYELVISVFKGGAFMRYRVGDVYRCIALDSPTESTHIPRFEYVDRIPTVIDIAGFTRITEYSVRQVIQLSGLLIKDWFACKEFTAEKHPYMHMYVEMDTSSYLSSAVTTEILKEHLGVYFKYLDNDYDNLKKILGMDPLEITILQSGTFDRYYATADRPLRHINPPVYEKISLLELNKNPD